MTQQIKCFRFSEYGGPEILTYTDATLPPAGQGEISIQHEAIGLNFIDIYHRKGIFAAKLPLPSGLGVEGVGLVTGLGAGVSGFTLGDRVAYVGGPPGAYATYRNLPAARAVKVPADLDSTTVAAAIFKGLTAEYLVHRCVPVAQGDTVLVHAAAGGVGSLASQWLSRLGARVIGTVGGPDKMDTARRNGCDAVIDYRGEDFAARVRDLTAGHGVRAVFDSVGAVTFEGSLASLAPRGTLVSFGESSGPVPPIALGTLGAKGSLFVTRPSIAHYTADRPEYEAAAARLFAALTDGTLRLSNISTYPLDKAAKAQSEMEERRTTGSIVLLPDQAESKA